MSRNSVINSNESQLVNVFSSGQFLTENTQDIKVEEKISEKSLNREPNLQEVGSLSLETCVLLIENIKDTYDFLEEQNHSVEKRPFGLVCLWKQH